MKLDIDKYRNVSYETRTNCMICGHPSLPSVINLPKLPMTEIYVSEKVNENIGIADQGLDFCTNCGHAQLRNVIDVELQYGETFSYFFRTGESATGSGQVLTGIKGAKCVDGLSIRYYGEGKEGGMPADCAVADRFMEIDDSEGLQPPKMEMPPDGISVGRVFVAQNSMRFHVGANQNQTVGISVEGTSSERLGRGVVNSSGFENLGDIDVKTFQGAQDTLALVDAAISSITTSRGDLGAFQKNTLESNLSNLRIQNENMINSESVIRDVDMAKEMASFTKNQIKSQAATAMLAQANQLPQNVLSLLQ